MNDVFQEFLDNFIIVYFDNILIFSKDKKDHEQHVWMVLQKLHEAKVLSNLKSVYFTSLKSSF